MYTHSYVYVYDPQNMRVQKQSSCSSAVLSRVSSRSDKAGDKNFRGARNPRRRISYIQHSTSLEKNFVSSNSWDIYGWGTISRASHGTMEILPPTIYRNALIALISRERENSGIVPRSPRGTGNPRSGTDFEFSGRPAPRDDIGSRDVEYPFAVMPSA